MALDKFGNYSRSVREGSRVRRVFLGKGQVAAFAAALDRERRLARAARRAEEATLAQAQGRLRDLGELVDLMMRATLTIAGYHRHDRGPWRRRRMKDATVGMSGLDTAEIGVVEAGDGQAGHAQDASGPKVGGVPDEDLSATRRAIADLVRRAERGDLSVMPDLRRLLDDRPQLWKHCGDAAGAAEDAWVAVAGGTNLLARESLARQLAEMKAELARPDAPRAERLLVERVAISWLQMAQADGALAQAGGTALSDAQLNLLVGRQERAQRMHLAAIKALATVQKLVPTKAEVAQVQATTKAAEVQEPSGVAELFEPALTIAGETIGFEPKAGRKRKKAEAKPAAAERAATLPEAILDRMRGLAVAGEEN